MITSPTAKAIIAPAITAAIAIPTNAPVLRLPLLLSLPLPLLLLWPDVGVGSGFGPMVLGVEVCTGGAPVWLTIQIPKAAMAIKVDWPVMRNSAVAVALP